MVNKDDGWCGIVADTEVTYQKNDRISVRSDEIEVHVIRTPEGYVIDIHTTDELFIGTQCVRDDELKMIREAD